MGPGAIQRAHLDGLLAFPTSLSERVYFTQDDGKCVCVCVCLCVRLQNLEAAPQAAAEMFVPGLLCPNPSLALATHVSIRAYRAVSE